MKNDNRIFAIDVSILEVDELFDFWYDKQRQYRQEKIDRMKFDKGKRLELGAGIVMEKALEAYSLSDEEIKLSDEGRPYVEGDNCFFNISHTDEIAVCAVSDKQVGVDIEGPREFKDSLIKYTFSEKEIALADETAVTYSRLWTIKESVMKWTGMGLGLSPKLIEISADHLSGDERSDRFLANSIEYRIEIDHDDYREIANKLRLTLYEHEDYSITVCSEYGDFNKEIEWIVL